MVRTRKLSFDNASCRSTEIHHTRFVRTTLSNHKGVQSYSSAIAKQVWRISDLRCRAIRCLSRGCCYVPYFAAFSSSHRNQCIMQSSRYCTRYRHVRVYSSFLLSLLIIFPVGPPGTSFFSFFLFADQNATPTTSVRHTTEQQAQHIMLLVLRNRFFNQPRPSPLCRFHVFFSCCVGVADSVGRPRSGCLVLLAYYTRGSYSL